MRLLEQKFNIDNPGIFYTKKQLEEHNRFMKEYVFPLNEEINSDNFNPNGIKYISFVLAYERLSPEVKEILKDVYLEYRILYFKKKIENIIRAKTFKQDKEKFYSYVIGLRKISGEENTEEFLRKMKEK